MGLTKYQFELLTYIEKKGPLAADKRDISNNICISGKQISKDLDFLLSKKRLFWQLAWAHE